METTHQNPAKLDPILTAYQATTLWREFTIPSNWATVTAAMTVTAIGASNPTEKRAAYDQVLALLEQTRANTTPPRGGLAPAQVGELHAWINEQQQALRAARP
jgi:hypothetical protein